MDRWMWMGDGDTLQNTDDVYLKRQVPPGETFGIYAIPSLLLKSVSTWQSLSYFSGGLNENQETSSILQLSS